jgi:chorismate synthase
MNSNTFGTHFRLTTFGESHGFAMGAVIDGCPAGVEFNLELLKDFLARRRPGQSKAVSARNEADEPQILSGVFDGKTLGTPIAVMVVNQDQRSADYQNIVRKGHADDMWAQKFEHSDLRGGGRASGRETLARVIGGAIAKMFCLSQYNEVKVSGRPTQIGPIVIETKEDLKKAEEFLAQAKIEGQSYGGIAQIEIIKTPSGLGQPVFRKLKSDLASAMLSIGATTGFELGEGFKSASAKGTDFHLDSDVYGGIRGGISTGDKIDFRIAFKPTSSILDVAKKGRHDPCIVLRAIPVLEAMTWLVLADHILWQRLDKR